MKQKNKIYSFCAMLAVAVGAVCAWLFGANLIGAGIMTAAVGAVGTAGSGNTAPYNQVAGPASVTNGMDGEGKHLNGGNGAETDLVREVVPGLLKDDIDDEIVKMAFSSTPINAMTRDMGYRQVKSIRYQYYSTDLRSVMDSVDNTAGYTFTHTDLYNGTDAEQKSKPKVCVIKVANGGKFDVTDQIMFSGVAGYKNNGQQGVDAAGNVVLDLTARVVDINGNNLSVLFLNAPSPADTSSTITINDATEVAILGHAACETDAATVPQSVLPTAKEQYMQKFMVQSLISNVMLESDTHVKWTEADIEEALLQQMQEDIEKTFVFGKKSWTYDATTRNYTYTTSGIIEQIVENGGHVLSYNQSTFTEKTLVDMITTIFDGNSGSNTRYMYSGRDVENIIYKLPLKDGFQQHNVGEAVKDFEYEFRKLRVSTYNILNYHHPLFDKVNRKNIALILDKQYIQKRVFWSMREWNQLMRETGSYDGKSKVWCELSSVVVKYAACHALVTINMDGDPDAQAKA